MADKVSNVDENQNSVPGEIIDEQKIHQTHFICPLAHHSIKLDLRDTVQLLNKSDMAKLKLRKQVEDLHSFSLEIMKLKDIAEVEALNTSYYYDEKISFLIADHDRTVENLQHEVNILQTKVHDHDMIDVILGRLGVDQDGLIKMLLEKLNQKQGRQIADPSGSGKNWFVEPKNCVEKHDKFGINKLNRNIDYLKSKNKDLMAEKQDLEMELHDAQKSSETLKIKSDKFQLEKKRFAQKKGISERILKSSRSRVLELTEKLRCAETENLHHLKRIQTIENEYALKLKNKKMKMIEFIENSFDASNP